jgi:hypothetical protein
MALYSVASELITVKIVVPAAGNFDIMVGCKGFNLKKWFLMSREKSLRVVIE